MRVGDLVKVNETHWRGRGMIGIIVRDYKDQGVAFKVLFSDGKVISTLHSQLEVISEN